AMLLMEEGETTYDHFVTMVSFGYLPNDFPSKPHQMCLPSSTEPHTAMNYLASMRGFRPISRMAIVFITLTGLLYFIVELTYLPFILVALDLLATVMGTIFYIYKHREHIFDAHECTLPASYRVFESSLVLTNFILLSLACLYIVNLHQCKVVVEKKKRGHVFVQGSKSDLKKINKMVGYDTIRRSRKSRSRKSGKSSRKAASSRESKRSHSRSSSSRSSRSGSSRRSSNSTRSTTLSNYP
ncbi:hypothetical protein PMAYCL1PPCAC_18990, partial [Pristionchus mayeri]